ncbi:hypothetical protein LTR91_002315 [Friedmanniomyces endolithicus]|uniref:Uncharacterized protein n=1 Tax=Friedmanniomyces endolithicus TaxID=329885 RepID=A0AAN6FRI3_9PEZI|nr:hypothetical protein LTR35_005510 [Friedmanniomyces endolithicus]KAK0297540.1 hypothetical protein LTS00_003671 [Friedmanniomyces endolithicus]KAK0321990.1 hypothetical protein LTR82_006963 [Friedmanniomyces endolithicus]KAK0930812.1 hypothetical protein LTR57_001194 [Friedmanniomyces endolithicus]KAK1008945.1 hypothetical protein LTR54_005744 [Friedmanniomyces endolithicus]
MKAATSSHIRKRQYQPSINTYFNDHAGSSQTSRSPLSPPLDAATQASLLSVGMRVRKSVPEGYKTHKTVGVDGFPFPSTAPAIASAPPRSSHSDKAVASRGLMPFCGLHKTGGLAYEPQAYVPSSSAPAAVGAGQTHDRVDTPGLTSSQHTISSTQSSFASLASTGCVPSKKRTFEEEMEDDLDVYFDEVDAVDSTIAARVIAMPKASLRRVVADEQLQVVDGQDFDDAAFLAPMDLDEA